MTRTFLVDTNSYVRIARRVEILGDHGELALRLTDKLIGECDHSPNLKSKFEWMHQPPHPECRKKWRLPTPDHVKARIAKKSPILLAALADVLADFKASREDRGDYRVVLSPVDQSVLCAAYAMGYGIITDEGALTHACDEFEVERLGTFDLLAKLHAEAFIPRDAIDTLVLDWQRDKDAPKGWVAQYRAYFGTDPPFV